MNILQMAQAGAIVSEADPKLDTVSAREYRHRALGDRPVVRLVSDSLGTAEDLTLEFHGFSLHQTEAVGYQLRKGLGFPGWALIHDPERAAFALQVLKQFRAQAKLARSRPGAAKEGFDEIAERLGRSVPHFLPSFYEEAGRVFLDSGNAKMGQTMFGKARQAEKVHALKVDESLRRESFLEFALAGAVSIKTLSEYGKELSDEHDPEQAYLHFRELCLRRTLGGMPPWSGMLKELKRLAKASNKKVKQEERALLEEVLSAPAVSRAPIEFWNSAKETVAGLCQERPELRKTLLHLFPIFSGDRLKQGGVWLDLLDQWGATALLETEPDSAAWLSRMLGHFYHWSSTQPNPDQMFSLVQRLAPTLLAQGRAVVTVTDTWRADLDLLELLASHQIPLSVDTKHPHAVLNLSNWAANSGPERPKDPRHLSQLPAVRPLLLSSLERYFGTEPFDSVSAPMHGWKSLKKSWLEAQIEELERGALPTLADTLDRWELVAKGKILEDYPDLRERLRRLNRQAVLARSLRGFVPDELTWPALEKAINELGVESTVSGLFPHAVVMNAQQVIAVGFEGEIARHELKLPSGSTLETAAYIEGEFLLFYQTSSERKAVWSDGRECEFTYFYGGLASLRCAELPDVGLTFGDRAVRAGDSSLQRDRMTGVVCDGQTCWRLEWLQNENLLREFDPRTGSGGRCSWPQFFEDWIEPDARLEVRTCELFPLPTGLLTSPLGAKQGRAGWRIRKRGEQWEGETIAGQSYRGDEIATGIINIVGAERVIHSYHSLPSISCDGTAVSNPRITPNAALWKLPSHWWHLYQVRSREDSQRLRKLRDDEVDSLKLGDSHLQRAHQAMVENSHELFERLQAFLVEPQEARLASVTSEQLKELIASLALPLYNTHSLSDEVAAVSSLLPASAPPEGLWAKFGRMFSRTSISAPLFNPVPFAFIQSCLSHFAALAWRLVTPFANRAELESGLTLFSWWADSPLFQKPHRFRRIQVRLPKYENQLVTLAQGNSRYLLAPSFLHHSSHQGFEATNDETFRVPTEATLESSQPCNVGWATAERLSTFIKLARANGPLPWKRAHAERLSEITGLSYAESCLLWTGFPHFYNWQSSFLPAEMREAMGVKTTDAKLARENLRTLTFERRLELFSQAMPDDPVQLWRDTEACVERLGEVWNRLQGARLTISNEVLKVLSSFSYLKPAEFLAAFTEPSSGVFSRDGRGEPTGWRVEVDPADSFEQHHLALALSYLAYFFEYLPVGDPVRQTVVKAWPFIEERLKNPHLLFHARNLEPGCGENAEQWRALLGGTDNGRVLMQTSPWGDSSFYYRPAKVEPDDPILKALGASDWEALQAVKRPEFAEFIKRFSQTPVPQGGYETNPTFSAPELIGAVQERLDLSENEAVLYLQTLTLLQPTAKNIQLWNDWSAAVYKKTAAALTERGLLLQAKRSRAGRAYFLPGGWVEQKAPFLPFESWKASLYGISPQTRLRPGQFFILTPSHQLFQRAWQRVTSGDTPAYEEVKSS